MRPAQATAGGLAASPFSLTAAAISVTGFQYTGNVSVSTATGPTQAMEFVMSGASATNLGLSTACAPSHLKFTVSTATSPHTTAVALVIDATELVATINGTAFDWTVAAPPPTHPLAGDTGTLGAVTATSLAMSAASLSLAGYAASASSC